MHPNERFTRILLAALPLLAPAWAGAATIILDDGGVHTISAPSDPVAVSNATTLIIQDGAVITGGAPSISIDSTSFFTATGSAITGGTIFFGLGGTPALDSAGSTTISGGTFQGGSAVLDGGDGADISGPATISGGTFQGGSARVGGNGASFSGPATISGGTFQGGLGVFIVGGPGVSISGFATISGGTFQGGIGPNGFTAGPGASFTGAATVQVLGGLFAGPFIQISLTSGEADFFGSLAFTGGVLTGALADGTPINQPVSLGAGTTVLSSPGEVRFLGPAAVPAPASLVLLCIGLLGPLAAGWIRRGQSRVPGDC